MSTFEYRIIGIHSILRQHDFEGLQKLLNDLGNDGWEVISSHKHFIILIREKPTQQEVG